jgi:hypothetical protein
MDRDEYVAQAEAELEQAVQEWNDAGEVFRPEERARIAQVYSLISIARSLDRLANMRTGGSAT